MFNIFGIVVRQINWKSREEIRMPVSNWWVQFWVSKNVVVAIFVFSFAMLSNNLFSHPWPMAWHDHFGTGRTPDVSIDRDSLRLIYSKPIESREACVISSGGFLYIGNTQYLFCWNAFSGVDVWNYNTGLNYFIPTPALNPAGDIVYFVQERDIIWRGNVYACYTSNGNEYWHNILATMSSWISAPPLVDYSSSDTAIYIVDYSNYDGYVHAFYPDGSVKFSNPVPDIGGQEDLTVQALDPRRNGHYVSGINQETRVLAFDLSGNYKWSYNKGDVGCGGISVDSVTGRIFASGTTTHKIFALDSLGNFLWAKDLSDSPRHPCIGGNNTVVVPAGDTIFSYLLNGTLVWKFSDSPGVIWSQVALDASNNVCATTDDGKIFVISSAGSERFNVKISNSALGPPVIVDDGDSCTWIFVTDGDSLYALNYCVPAGVTESASSLINFSIFPNPLISGSDGYYSLRVKFTAEQSSNVSLSIYDVSGNLVKKLLDGKVSCGAHEILWNANEMPGGIYFCHIQVNDFIAIRKLVVLK